MAKKDIPALLLVDLQKGFDDIEYWGGQRNNLCAESNAGRILTLSRECGLPIFHIQHCSTIPTSPLHPSNTGNAFKDFATPIKKETVIKKNVNSAFIGTTLKTRLGKLGLKRLIIVGLTTDHCISTTTRMAGNLGYDTFLVEDATATFNKKGTNGQNFSAELIHETAIASLKDEFATIINTDTLLKDIFLREIYKSSPPARNGIPPNKVGTISPASVALF
ncbi:MAG TPA: cysteine hydrolase family protein [Cyclobacteriaceae bacterium]|jgi:nicotinamidase-related amidase|nr:cysteine hydrolase family protein [Cyclobacteriaceae bacterium]